MLLVRDFLLGDLPAVVSVYLFRTIGSGGNGSGPSNDGPPTDGVPALCSLLWLLLGSAPGPRSVQPTCRSIDGFGWDLRTLTHEAR
uniref:Putative secreted protein n=1 Tax=Anopheles triannulatus TaxID=58253 RepID=A0A2M4B6A9_9DIPT